MDPHPHHLILELWNHSRSVDPSEPLVEGVADEAVKGVEVYSLRAPGEGVDGAVRRGLDWVQLAVCYWMENGTAVQALRHGC